MSSRWGRGGPAQERSGTTPCHGDEGDRDTIARTLSLTVTNLKAARGHSYHTGISKDRGSCPADASCLQEVRLREPANPTLVASIHSLSGAGFFLEYEVSPNGPKLARENWVFGDVYGELDRLEFPVGFLRVVADGHVEHVRVVRFRWHLAAGHHVAASLRCPPRYPGLLCARRDEAPRLRVVDRYGERVGRSACPGL